MPLRLQEGLRLQKYKTNNGQAIFLMANFEQSSITLAMQMDNKSGSHLIQWEPPS